MVIDCGGVFACEPLANAVESGGIIARHGLFLCGIGPSGGGEQEESTGGASVEIASGGLLEGGKALVVERHEREAALHDLAGNLAFAVRDTRAEHDRAMGGGIERGGQALGVVAGGVLYEGLTGGIAGDFQAAAWLEDAPPGEETARALHLMERALEQVRVAKRLEMPAQAAAIERKRKIGHAVEETGIGALFGKARGIIADIGGHSRKLTLAKKNGIDKALCPECRSHATGRRTSHLRPHAACRRTSHLPPRTACRSIFTLFCAWPRAAKYARSAARLETADYIAERLAFRQG